jgi:hypothetical protein
MGDNDDETGAGTADLSDRRGSAPVGIRPVDAERRRARPIVWARPGTFELALGDRVAVLQSCYEWLGEVVIPPDRLVEWPDPGPSQVPVVVRRAMDDEWPAPPLTAGRRLLDSLRVPPALLDRSRPGSAPGPLVARSTPGPGEPTQDQRSDQERGGDQRTCDRTEPDLREPRHRGHPSAGRRPLDRRRRRFQRE